MEFFLLIVCAILAAGLSLAITSRESKPPDEPIPKPRMVYDYEYTDNIANLRSVLGLINADGWELIAVTQNDDRYTIIFRRPMYG